MNTKVRSGVFETNSSSTHSLSLSPTFANMVEAPLPESMLNEGVLHIFPGEFGWEIEDYYDVQSKASYLFTDAMRHVAADDEHQIDPNDEVTRNQNVYLKMIADAVKEYAGVETVFHKDEASSYYPYGYIDHQSIGETNTVWDEGVNGVVRFLFSNDSFVHTDNDNH